MSLPSIGPKVDFPDPLEKALVDRIRHHYHGIGTMVTPDMIFDIGTTDQARRRALSYLASYGLLHIEMLYVDNEGEEWPVPIEEFIEANNAGEYFHPRSGTPVPNFLDKMFTSIMTTEHFHEVYAINPKRKPMEFKYKMGEVVCCYPNTPDFTPTVYGTIVQLPHPQAFEEQADGIPNIAGQCYRVRISTKSFDDFIEMGVLEKDLARNGE